MSPEEAKEKLTLETFINTKKGDEKQTVLNRIAELNKINEERDAALKEVCANKTSAECASHIDLLKNYLNNYEQARSTYPFIDLTPEDRKKVESYLNSYAPSHWDYAIANYAKDHDISIEEATAKFKPAMYSEKFAVIAATYYGMKGIGNLGKGSVIDNLKATVKNADDALIAGKGTAGQVDKAVQTGNGNLPVVREGKVTYEPLAKPDANELRAGQRFAELGYDVKYKATASDQGIKNVRTQDLWVEGVGKVDVITPKVITEKSMLRRIEEKNNQTNSVILQVDLSVKDMQSIAARTWGKPTANNINTVFFQNSKGQIIRYDRPNIRNK